MNLRASQQGAPEISQTNCCEEPRRLTACSCSAFRMTTVSTWTSPCWDAPAKDYTCWGARAGPLLLNISLPSQAVLALGFSNGLVETLLALPSASPPGFPVSVRRCQICAAAQHSSHLLLRPLLFILHRQSLPAKKTLLHLKFHFGLCFTEDPKD